MTAVFVTKWLTFLLLEVLLAGAGFLYVITSDSTCPSVSNQSFLSGVPLKLGVNYGNSTGTLWSNVSVSPCTTLYQAMQQGGWVLEIRTFGGLGVYIAGINGVHEGGGAYWQWWEWEDGSWMLGPVGVSSYTISESEVILWYLSTVGGAPPLP